MVQPKQKPRSTRRTPASSSSRRRTPVRKSTPTTTARKPASAPARPQPPAAKTQGTASTPKHTSPPHRHSASRSRGGRSQSKRHTDNRHSSNHTGARSHGASSRPASAPQRTPTSSAPADRLRLYPLGGNEEVGRNCTVFEWGDDIIILDMGLQFPEEDMPGVDYIIPNIESLKAKKEKHPGAYFVTRPFGPHWRHSLCHGRPWIPYYCRI